MATTGTDIYQAALALMGERPDARNIEDYTRRAVPLINLIFSEIYNFLEEGICSQTQSTDTSQQPSNARPAAVSKLTDEIDADYRISESIVPYALAARLIIEEDPQRADYFDAQYEKNLKTFKTKGTSGNNSNTGNTGNTGTGSGNDSGGNNGGNAPAKGKIVPIKRVCF